MSTTTELTVRLMFQRDLPQVLAIERRRPGRRWGRDDFRPVFEDPRTDGWVAEVGDHIVGHLVFRTDAHGVTLLNLGVAPYWRRQGVARGMVEKIDERQPAVVRATVPESNLPALLLLKQAGYRAVRVLRGHFGNEDGYVLERRPAR